MSRFGELPELPHELLHGRDRGCEPAGVRGSTYSQRVSDVSEPQSGRQRLGKVTHGGVQADGKSIGHRSELGTKPGCHSCHGRHVHPQITDRGMPIKLSERQTQPFSQEDADSLHATFDVPPQEVGHE